VIALSVGFLIQEFHQFLKHTNICADEFKEMLNLAEDSGRDNGNEMR
jgi:hypothetical protein